MKINTKVRRWIVEISIILIVLSVVRFWMQRDVVSGMAPNISTWMLDGQYFDLYKNKKRPMLVHFWATWCPVCKLEQQNIENISKEHPVITIAMQSGDNDDLLVFMQQEELSFRVINDQTATLSRMYNIKGVPVSFVVNKENKIVFTEVGYTTELGLRVRLWWAGL